MMKSEIIQLKINMRSNIDITEECFSNLGLPYTLTYDL